MVYPGAITPSDTFLDECIADIRQRNKIAEGRHAVCTVLCIRTQAEIRYHRPSKFHRLVRLHLPAKHMFMPPPSCLFQFSYQLPAIERIQKLIYPGLPQKYLDQSLPSAIKCGQGCIHILTQVRSSSFLLIKRSDACFSVRLGAYSGHEADIFSMNHSERLSLTVFIFSGF